MRYLLQQAVTRAAERDPDHEAARCRAESLSYGELELRSNGLARILAELGVRRGDRVGIYTRKCIELPVAIHGILKAGAAYVPLDPTAPPARLRMIIDRCGIQVVVTREERRAIVAGELAASPSLTGCVGLDPGDDLTLDAVSWDTVTAAATSAPPEVGLIEQDLAYVLFTSGSTGEPKGIMHSHRSGLAFAEVATQTYGLGPDDRISNHAPLHFDLSTLDFFATAVAGATTIVIPEEHTRLPASLSQLMADERMTVFYSVPLAMIQLLLRGALRSRDLSALRWMLFGGEPFPVKHLRALMAELPGARFANVYGPTEVNGCTHYLVPPLPEGSDEPLPIGRLYENAEALIVDPDDRPSPPGETGELLIRSGTRMRGYWSDPELTAAATYRRPTPGGDDDLFHRTGDLVQLRPDGEIAFLGRKDRQIKTRGHRVELDEIEAALLTHPAVEEAAAVAVPDGEGSLMVVACLRLIGGEMERPRDLDRHLRDQLPPYAVPARFDVLADFPRTTTGKIDRRRLRHEALGSDQT